MDYPFKELVCEVCGKTFIPAVEHIYHETRNGIVHHICGYNCNCAFNRKHPKVKGGKRKNESELFAEND